MKENQEMHRMMIRVQEYLGLPLQKMVTNCRQEGSIYGRHLFCYMCQHFRLGTLEQMGYSINKNYATAHNGIKRIKEWQVGDRSIKKDINALINLTLNEDVSLTLKYILQETPPSALPSLVEHIKAKHYDTTGY